MRAIPDDNLSYPVFLTLSNGGAGSGFFLKTPDSAFLVTAKHVLFNNDSGALLADEASFLSYSRDPRNAEKNIFNARLRVLLTSGDLRPHPQRDIAVMRIGRTPDEGEPERLDVIPGITLQQLAAYGVVWGELSSVKRFSDVLVANEVYLFGYPISLGLKHLPQIQSDRPLLRKGIIAGLNHDLQSIILDCPVYPGNSGGPVLEVETDGGVNRFRNIGVVSQFVPFVETWMNTVHGYTNTNIANSGYSVVTPIDFALELL